MVGLTVGKSRATASVGREGRRKDEGSMGFNVG